MNLPEFFTAAAQAWTLIAMFPLHWTAVVLVFLVAVESLMFIPFIGFVVKLAVASVVATQVLAMFHAAAAGITPSVTSLLSGFTLPVSAQLALVFSALLPFAVGIAYLYAKGGPQATQFFFGNITKMKPPPPALFIGFKYVMQLMAVPFTFLAGAVVIKGLSGVAALTAALVAAVTNWLPVLLLALLAVAFEWFSSQLTFLVPKPVAAVFGGVLLVAFLVFSFSLSYTLSAKVFESPSQSSAQLLGQPDAGQAMFSGGISTRPFGRT